MKEPRTEEQIFFSIVELCNQRGFPHIIASLALNFNAVKYNAVLTGKDLSRKFSGNQLSRNEINALIGCMVKKEIDWTMPEPERFNEMLDTSKSLLYEHHVRLQYDAECEVSGEMRENVLTPATTGATLREQIFHAPESAHIVQFLDMAFDRYFDDTDFIKDNHGYSPREAKVICKAISESQAATLRMVSVEQTKMQRGKQSMLQGFRLNVSDISTRSGLKETVVEKFIDMFTWKVKDGNRDYNQIDDRNKVNTTPIIADADGTRYLFQYYYLVEAVYDDTFYRIKGSKDARYDDTAKRHRGKFTENFLETSLKRIFPESSVISNVDVYRDKKQISEIDCLVVYGGYALLFQTKSRRLSIEARKGNPEKLKSDFNHAVQHAYMQAVRCGKEVGGDNVEFLRQDKSVVDMKQVEFVYPICVLADHYPALTAQARTFLETDNDPNTAWPIVCDLFLIDIITEILPSPLYFIDYVIWRVQFGDRAHATTDIATFGFYLKSNTRIDWEFQRVLILETMALEVDVAMKVRREGLQGECTPEGTLTKARNTLFGRVLSVLEQEPNQNSVKIGLAILAMDKRTIVEKSSATESMILEAGQNGQMRDWTIAMGNIDAGLTVHINGEPINEAEKRIWCHMHVKKYSMRAGQWFGLIFAPSTGIIRKMVRIEGNHEFNPIIEEIIRKIGNVSPSIPSPIIANDIKSPRRFGAKVGRNLPCPCESGKKYKKCCGA